MIKAFYDRNKDSIDGVFTLIKVEDNLAVKLFDRLPARSGQNGHANTDWVRGKSPIPFGKHELSLNSVSKREWAGATGVGEFFPISSPGFFRKIEDPKNKYNFRLDIGLHPENNFKGSAGCIVLLVDTPERKAEVEKLFAFLRDFYDVQQTIPLEVV